MLVDALDNFPYIPADPLVAPEEPFIVIFAFSSFVAFESDAYIPAESSLEITIFFLFVISESLLPYIPAEFFFFTFITPSFSPIALSTKIPTVLSTSRSIFPVFIAFPLFLSPVLFLT